MIVAAEVKAHFAPRKPDEKQTFDPETIRWAKDFIEQPSQIQMNLPDDYSRTLRRSASSHTMGSSCASGKRDVAQLREQAVQSIPPLIVQTPVSTADRLVITDDLRRQAKEAGVTVEQLIGLEGIPGITEEEVKWQYVRGKPLVKPDEVKLLPTRMYDLHTWYMQKTANTNEESLMVKVKAEHYFHENALYVEFTELFQLFNQDALDKSIVSCYCL